jgi:type IV secretion system protein VirB10
MRVRALSIVLTVPCFAILAAGESSDRDFSGEWILDQQHSKTSTLPTIPNATLLVRQQGSAVTCTEGGVTWSLRLDGQESKYRTKDASMSSEAKWEGSALLINTLVSGPQNYVMEDRWELSGDRAVLTVTRLIRRGASETEATLVYHNRNRLQEVAVNPPPSTAGAPALAPGSFIIKAGTKIPLSLINTLSTRQSAEGDRVYLETAFPVTEQGRIVIPKGSFVAGTVTEVKRAGRVKGKAEMFLRFDSLTLPNGVTRDFRSRLDNSDAGRVDRNEGKIQGDSNKGGDARTVATAAGAGAGIGSIAGAAAGHAGMGAGVGAAAGAAAGLAGVLLTRGPDLVLPKGTTFEMVLDRPLSFEPHELESHR